MVEGSSLANGIIIIHRWQDIEDNLWKELRHNTITMATDVVILASPKKCDTDGCNHPAERPGARYCSYCDKQINPWH